MATKEKKKSKKKDHAPREYKGPQKRKQKGLVLVYTGEGKGKSTAAFGAVFRSLGRGYKVAVVQFIKGAWVSGEIKALEKFSNQVTYHSVGEGFTWNTKNLDQDIKTAKKGWDICLRLLKENKHHVYFFDEIIYVLLYKFLSENEVLRGIKLKDPNSHLILTGRQAPKRIVQRADLVTEMKCIKHPFQKGILAQPGIDF